MAVLPPKPESWAITPGRLFLARVVKKIGSGVDSVAGNAETLTQLELDAAQHLAWEDVLSDLAGIFDPSSWGEDPPVGLERPWQMLASAYYIQMENGVTTVDGRLIDTAGLWIRAVEEMINRFKLPDGDPQKKHMLRQNGTIIRPSPARVGTVDVKVSGGSDVLFTPDNDSAGYGGVFIGGSLQELQRLHGRRSQTAYQNTPVP